MIILFDSNAQRALANQIIFNDLGYNTIIARDVYQGLKACTLFEINIEFVLVNFEMPELDGYELLYHILYINKNISVYAYSSITNTHMIHKCMKKGFKGLIKLPTKYQYFQDLVKFHKSYSSQTEFLKINC